MKLKYVTVHKKVDEQHFERNCVAAILLKIEAIYSIWLPLKSDKVVITHLTMEIHFQTTDDVVGAGKVCACEQHI